MGHDDETVTAGGVPDDDPDRTRTFARIVVTGAAAAKAVRVPETRIPQSDPPASPPPEGSDPVPEYVGSYRILRLLAEGGMGAVYEAEQETPHRIIALKVIKPGYATGEMIRRFEREAQALGRLQHPGIAQIYEAGKAETPFGAQPYFAMELIQGRNLLAYATEENLDTRARLEILIEICDAVQHAHERGLIHRDLKPGNILVDATGHPKILDFGIARITDSDAQATRQTDVGQIIGTLPYMSPEQVMADPLAVDTRSDVYALGVILYELLAGKLPYNVSKKTLFEAVQVIRDQEASPLSSINRIYRGDVETIVSKALEKDKARRYSSAAEMAADIRRYLNNEPITARPPSTWYQLQKLAARNRAFVIGVAAVFVVLVAGVVASSMESVRARHAETQARGAESQARSERDRAVAAEAQANAERDRAETAEASSNAARDRAVRAEAQARLERDTAVAEKRRADIQTATATAINDFLQSDLLAQASANGQGANAKADPDIKVRTVLDRAAGRVAGRFKDKPQVEASIEATIGKTYWQIGLYQEAQLHLERALDLNRATLGRDNPVTLSVAETLGNTYVTAGKYAPAEQLLKEVTDAQLRLHGADAADSLRAMTGLASTYIAQGKFAQAEPILSDLLQRERRVLGPDDDITIDTMGSLARVFFVATRFSDAEAMLKEIIAVRTRKLGPDHALTVGTMNNLAVLYQRMNRYSEAESLYQKVIETLRQVRGNEHPETLNSLNNLGVLLSVEGKYSDAEPLYTLVLEQWKKQLGPEHPRTLSLMSNIGMLKQGQGKLAEAEAMAKTVLEVRSRVLGSEHVDTLESMKLLGATYEAEGKFAEADPLYLKALEIRRRVSGARHAETTELLTRIGELRVDQGRYAEAESSLREALDVLDKTAANDFRRYWTENLLGAALGGQRKFVDAEPLLTSGYDGMQRTAATVSDINRQKLLKAARNAAQLYGAWNKPEQAAEWVKRAGSAQ